MYSPSSRLLTVLELLQSHKEISGTEIARRLEVDKRTVRRYIVMLQDMGIPIEGERGPHGAYHLERGFKLPPMMFTDEEAVAITLSLLAMREFRFPISGLAVEGAIAKSERVLPEKLFRQVRALQTAIVFNFSTPFKVLEGDFLAILSLASHEAKQVRLSYEAWGGAATERVFDPYGIVFNDGFWYTAGYCHLREDLRSFRLDRIVALEALDGDFEAPSDFDILNYILNSVAQLSNPNEVEIILHTSFENAKATIPTIMGTLEETEKGVILRRSASQLEWFSNTLLAWDFPMTIVKPEKLREMVREIGRKALAMLD
jgi:predicted DNA-binding transcriptional regulator YafY